MGKQVSGGQEVAQCVVSGTFTGTGQSGSGVRGIASGPNNSQTTQVLPVFKDLFNIALWGTFVATIKLEKSFDGGVSWQVVSRDVAGREAAYTGPMNMSVYEPEVNILYRWNCTDFTSGTINYRISS